ncbi:MAG: hypothetical protein RIC80_00195 [Cyclobacteriaceae bacterium]
MSAMISCLFQRFPLVLLLLSLLASACGEEESPAPTVLGITANVLQADEGEQFAVTVRVDTPNRTGADISVPLIYEGIALSLIEGSDVTPVIQQDQEFNSLLVTVADDTTSTGDRELIIRIDESQVPTGLTLGNASWTVTIIDK